MRRECLGTNLDGLLISREIFPFFSPLSVFFFSRSRRTLLVSRDDDRNSSRNEKFSSLRLPTFHSLASKRRILSDSISLDFILA